MESAPDFSADYSDAEALTVFRCLLRGLELELEPSSRILLYSGTMDDLMADVRAAQKKLMQISEKKGTLSQKKKKSKAQRT